MELERSEALELLALVMVHINAATIAGEVSPRLAMLYQVRDRLINALEKG